MNGGKKMIEMDEEHWHIDRRIPVAVLLTLSLNLGAFVWWAASSNERLNSVETFMRNQTSNSERLVRLETEIKHVRDGMLEIKSLLQQRPQAGR